MSDGLEPAADERATAADTAPQGEVLVEAVDVRKTFGNVVALESASLTIRRGRTHALAGRNGAGKSTMVGVLTGLLAPDGGRVHFAGEPAPPIEDLAAWQKLVGSVPQKPNIIPALSVAENLFLNRLPRTSTGMVSWKSTTRDAADLLEEWDIRVSPTELAGNLTVEQRQLLEIARALSAGVKLVLLDEPTAALEATEVSRLFDKVHELQDRGVTFLFISHHLPEIYQICQDVTVFRDGSTVLSGSVQDVTKDRLVEALVGEESAAHAPRGLSGPTSATDARVALDVAGLSAFGFFQGVNLNVRQGEIVGLAGLKGSGKRTFGNALGGLVPIDGGKVTVSDGTADLSSPQSAIDSGIGSVFEDRHETGFVGGMGIDENLTMSVLNRISRQGVISSRDRRRTTDEMFDTMQIVAGSPQQHVNTLSGGNQQKVVIGRALATRPRALVLQHPTTGVDIASKAAIWSSIDGAREDGLGVLVISDEYDELSNCSRIYVMVRGRIVHEFEGLPSETELASVVEGD